MAFKVSSDKKQSRLRRMLPRMFGDFPADKMNDVDQREVLVRKNAALRKKLAAIPKTAASATERRFIGKEIFDICHQIKALNKKINSKRATMQPAWQDYLIQSCRELLGPEGWKKAMEMADEKSRNLGFRQDKK